MTANTGTWNLADDLCISRLLVGLWQIADMERDGTTLDTAAAASSMRPYVEAGLTTFDMADHYGSAEEIAGEYARRTGGDTVQLLTKWVPKPGAVTREQARQAVQRALQRLALPSLPLLQFHAWNYADPSYLDAFAYLQEMQAEGLVRHLGVTNVDTAHLRVLVRSGVPIVSNQISFSLLDRRARSGGMLQFCRENGISVLAFGTLAGGFLSDRWLGKPPPDADAPQTWSQMKYGRFIREAGGWEALQELLRALHDVARRHDVSVANVACRAILDEPAVGGVIIGARLGESQHIEENLRTLQLRLDDEDRRRIESAVECLRPIPGDCGDEYRRPPYLTASGDLSHHLESMPPPYASRTGRDGRVQVFSGTVWEERAGFCRAVRVGDRVLVSGTTATHGSRVIGGDDPEAQAHFVIDKIEGALQSAGARLRDVVRTRVYVRHLRDWEAAARAHGQRFGDIQPANTMVQAELVGEEYLVEMEAEAVIGSPAGPGSPTSGNGS